MVQIEGNPASPISRGRLCPKGSASLGLVPARTGRRRSVPAPYAATEWTDLELHEAMEMVADRVLDARERGWQEHDPNGARLRRTWAWPAWAARRLTTRRTTSSRSCSPRWAPSRSRTRPVTTPPPVPGLGTSFGRGGASDYQQDLVNSDCIVIMGSNMAEAHPVGFQWVMEAKRAVRG